ncbi:hypothetical protein LSTR_LSTR009718 [Laodelphax striatellus]|uniref:Uncharacterized protein n=1 Tax=Laodelphax striatellus TaxID=195883 RepID=A0A482WVL8_LAOST|nr:hypothetical protein LSTR_LSTR009718 [Laodelphax striatellus]
MPIYDWATSSLLNINMNQDILNIGNILRNSYYGSLAKVTEKKEEESQHPPPDVLPDVERDYKNDNPEPRSFVEEVLDEINEESESNRELNIERPPTDKDLPDIGSEDPKTIKPRSPAKCICGFSQGSTNSCSCFPETLVYYQYCSVPIPPTD